MRQPRNGNLRQLNKNTPRLLRDALLLYKLSKAFHTECLITIISVTLFPSNKFPRLLAEREIIANALFFLPTMSCAMLLCAMLFRANDQQYFAINAKLRNKDENMALSALENQIKTIYLYSEIKSKSLACI